MAPCFVLLFVQLNNVQVVKGTNTPTRRITLLSRQRYNQPRGVIQSADGVVLAKSVAIHGGAYKYDASTHWAHCSARSPATSPSPTAPPASRRLYGNYLGQHNRPIKTLGDLLTTPQETDTVTLTLSTKLQQTAQQALGGATAPLSC